MCALKKSKPQEILWPYQPLEHQVEVFQAFNEGYRKGVFVWHRRGGKDLTLLHLEWTRACMPSVPGYRKGTYYHFFPTYGLAKRAIWDGMDHEGRRFLDYIPKELLLGEPNETELQITFKDPENPKKPGSIWQLIGCDKMDKAARGTNIVGIGFSEYQDMTPRVQYVTRPIINASKGWEFYIGTPKGHNHFYKMWKMANKSENSSRWFTSFKDITMTHYLNGEPMVDQVLIDQDRMDGIPEDIIQQEYYCFPAGTRIWTDRGQIPIEQIAVNDVVLSHAGRWRKVMKTIRHCYDGPLTKIWSAGCPEPLRCTPTHPVRLANSSEQTYQWQKAGDVVPGESVTLPRLKRQEVGFVRMDKAARGTNIVGIGASLAEVIAWFIAEGSVAQNCVQFSLAAHETKFADRIAGYTDGIIRKTDTGLNVIVNSCWLADWLTTACGSGAASKRIPWHLIAGYEQEVYEALMDGDGCRGEYSGAQHVYSTVSYGLALDVQMLAHMLGYRAKVNKREAKDQTNVIEGRQVTVQDSYSVRVTLDASDKKFARPKVRPMKHGVASEISLIETEYYEGQIYNLAIQFDESYIAEGRVVHNCSFEGFQEGGFFADLVSQAYREQRIGDVPNNRNVLVNTVSDLGVSTADELKFCTWFFQVEPLGSIRVIDFHALTSGAIPEFVDMVRQKNYLYDRHFAPFDIKSKDISTGKDRITTARKLGVNFVPIPRVAVSTRINAGRQIFPRCLFDETRCEQGLIHLMNYRRKFDDKLNEFTSGELHDQHSHAGSAFAYLGMAFRESGYAESQQQVAEMDFNMFTYDKEPVAEIDFNPLVDAR